MTKHTQKNERGFVALISILILSTVLLATTLSLAQFGLANRYFILDLEQKSESEKLASSCVHIARIMVYNNPASSVGNVISEPIGTDRCSIVRITQNGSQSTVQTKGVKGNAITNLQVVINNTNGNFVSWNEIDSL